MKKFLALSLTILMVLTLLVPMLGTVVSANPVTNAAGAFPFGNGIENRGNNDVAATHRTVLLIAITHGDIPLALFQEIRNHTARFRFDATITPAGGGAARTVRLTPESTFGYSDDTGTGIRFVPAREAAAANRWSPSATGEYNITLNIVRTLRGFNSAASSPVGHTVRVTHENNHSMETAAQRGTRYANIPLTPITATHPTGNRTVQGSRTAWGNGTGFENWGAGTGAGDLLQANWLATNGFQAGEQTNLYIMVPRGPGTNGPLGRYFFDRMIDRPNQFTVTLNIRTNATAGQGTVGSFVTSPSTTWIGGGEALLRFVPGAIRNADNEVAGWVPTAGTTYWVDVVIRDNLNNQTITVLSDAAGYQIGDVSIITPAPIAGWQPPASPATGAPVLIVGVVVMVASLGLAVTTLKKVKTSKV